MRGIRAFVTKVPVDLEDTIDTSDHTTLQVQLGGDAQEQVHVHGVHVRLERPGRGPTVEHLQHGRFDLEVTAPVQGVPQRPVRQAAHLDVAAGLGADDQIHVALANPILFRQWLVSDRQRAERLRGQLPRIGQHTELAPTGRDDFPGGEQVVAEIHIGFERGQRLGPDGSERDHDLELGAGFPGPSLTKCHKTQFARVSEEDDPAGDADHLAGPNIGLQIRKLRT